MENRVYNFNPGPSTLPLSVLQTAQQELLNYKGCGMSIMEMSHRSKDFEAIIHRTEALFKELSGVGDDYRVLFLQGGASQQFSQIPINFLTAGQTAYYAVTGGFAEKAYQEAQKAGNVKLAASSAGVKHNRIPTQDELILPADAAYLHITTNNTIYGTEWHYTPETNGVPLIADMSSDILSRPLDYTKFDVVYAGAQKNLGPSGVVLVLIRKSMLEKVPENLPSMFSYNVMAKNDSLYNTPPTFSIYMLGLMLEWIKEQGGLSAMGKRNADKAALIYDTIDQSDFYRGHAQKDSRSLMNITFLLPREELDKKFIAEAAAVNLAGLKGYRSMGGIRASVYNAMTKEGCAALASFMQAFAKNNG